MPTYPSPTGWRLPDPPPSPHPLSYAPPDARQSPAGVISFVCGLIAMLGLCLSLTAGSAGSPAVSKYFGIFIFVVFVAVLLLGLLTGILGVLPPRRKRALAIAGLILNGLVALFLLLLILIAWLVNR